MLEIQMIVATAVIGLCVGFFFYIVKLFNQEQESSSTGIENSANDIIKSNTDGDISKPRRKSESASQKKQVNKHAVKEQAFQHPWLVANLKGHSDRVEAMDLSSNGKFLASTCLDRSLLLWPTKHIVNSNHKAIRGNVSYDHGAHIKWSPDNKCLVVHKEVSRVIEVYKVGKKEGSDSYSIQPALDFPILHPVDDDVIALDMDPNGKYLMTCSTNKNDLAIFDLKGTLLARMDTVQMTTFFANISPCGKYVAASGFTPDVKVWSIKFNKSGGFEKAQRAFELTGHTSGIYHFTWRNDSARVATISKDGTWRLYNVEVDLHLGQEPRAVESGKIEVSPNSKIALSPDGRVMAISCDKSVLIYSLDPAKLIKQIDNVHSSPINGLLFDAESKWLITSGDKHIRVFHNVIGFQKTLVDLKKTLEEAVTEGHKERLNQQIDELKIKLKQIGDAV